MFPKRQMVAFHVRSVCRASTKTPICSQGTSFCTAESSSLLFPLPFILYSERITEIACTRFAQVQPELKKQSVKALNPSTSVWQELQLGLAPRQQQMTSQTHPSFPLHAGSAFCSWQVPQHLEGQRTCSALHKWVLLPAGI